MTIAQAAEKLADNKAIMDSYLEKENIKFLTV